MYLNLIYLTQSMRRRIKILLISDTMFILANALLAPVFAIYALNMGGDILVIGELSSVFAISTGIMLLVFGRIEDRHKKAPLIIVSYVIMATGYIAYMFVTNVGQLLAIQVLLALGIAMNIPAYDALFSIYLEHNKEAQQWGTYYAISYFLSGVGAIIGAGIVEQYGFNGLFMIMTILGVIGILVSMQLVYHIRKLPRKHTTDKNECDKNQMPRRF